jgi:hypothetical protein
MPQLRTLGVGPTPSPSKRNAFSYIGFTLWTMWTIHKQVVSFAQGLVSRM